MSGDSQIMTPYDAHYEMTRAMLADRTLLELLVLATQMDPPVDEPSFGRMDAVADLVREMGR